MHLIWLTASLPMLPSHCAAQVQTQDGLSAVADGTSLSRVALDGRDLAGVRVGVQARDPRADTLAQGFGVTGAWTAEDGCLRLAGEVRAEGEADRAADLVVRVEAADIALSTMAADPLLLPEGLLSRLPLVSLRTGGEDCLALAVPPDALAIQAFRRGEGFVELRFRFGFTREAQPELRMRAPFSCVLYRTDPRWHFRSALEGYYRLFPGPFEPFIREAGGWFFAAQTPDLPNPQHFHYHEGGPGGWEQDDERGLGTYPYQESSSWTISLPAGTLPKSYDEAMARFSELEQQVTAKAWAQQSAFTLDPAVKRSGARSILADSGETGVWTGAKQAIAFEQPVSDPIEVRGWSRAEGIAGEQGNDYSIYVDVCYASGGYLFGQCATFRPGTHDWEMGEHTIRPTEPVAELRVYCLLRNREGRAWFDDVHIGPVGEPATNWVVNPGFEEDASRTDLQEVRDHACTDVQGQYVVYITDNLSADVGPDAPLNLLRFTLNVDPDLPSAPDRRSVAARQFDYYDRVFRDLPSVDGCYIDSVSAWCYGVLNGRRDQWPANDEPFTYDPGTLKVAAAGRFAMTDFLRALQQRYHPQGKAIFTNIHVNTEAFPLYLVSDVPGIESSLFDDQDSTFFYRASSYRKPVLLMNFMNLHGLDKRETAIRFHQNAAQWGELPSTGRFVQEAYALYGDVTHAWMPAIQELARAGWEPVPLAAGAQAERFAAEGVVYFTVRAPQETATQTLRVEPEALTGLGEDLAAIDAVSLEELPLGHEGDAVTLTFTHGQGQVTVVRLGPRAGVTGWLVDRARRHVQGALRARGKAGQTPELLAAQEALAGATPAAVAGCRERVNAALSALPADEGDLFILSQRRELQQALQALGQ